jgi:hypothetical protein
MKRNRSPFYSAALLAVAGLSAAPYAAAAQPAALPGIDASPIPAEQLDAMRGGLVAPSGLVVSFGIERVAQVNGEIISSSRVNIPDISRMTPAEAQALARLSETRVLQVGGGSTVSPGSMGGLVIQNSLDGQRIAALTTVDVGVNTLAMFKDLNLNSALNSAIVAASSSP